MKRREPPKAAHHWVRGKLLQQAKEVQPHHSRAKQAAQVAKGETAERKMWSVLEQKAKQAQDAAQSKAHDENGQRAPAVARSHTARARRWQQ